MGSRRDRKRSASSPSQSSSSDFEFSIAVSPRKSSSSLCPADELFYKGQLLPLHLSPRISMVRTLLLSSSSSSTSSSNATASRDSTGSTSSTDSSDSFALLAPANDIIPNKSGSRSYFSRLFKKNPGSAPLPVKKTTAKEMLRKYFNKVRPLYEKLTQTTSSGPNRSQPPARVITSLSRGNSGNPRKTRRSSVASCPSSMRSSPSHSGVLTRTGFSTTSFSSESSTMEELQSAIQGAIAHCKNSMVQQSSSNEI